MLFLRFGYAQVTIRLPVPGIPMHKYVRRYIPLTLSDSLGDFNLYSKPITKKISKNNKELNRQALGLWDAWKNEERRIQKKMKKMIRTNPGNYSQEYLMKLKDSNDNITKST